jgi:hypothetical protein
MKVPKRAKYVTLDKLIVEVDYTVMSQKFGIRLSSDEASYPRKGV